MFPIDRKIAKMQLIVSLKLFEILKKKNKLIFASF